MKRFNKLVRDRIPEIIRARGEEAVTHVADDTEYWRRLKAKLAEECGEFVRDESASEVADILEVLDAIIAFKAFDRAEIETIKARKHKERGGFEGRIILDETGP